MVRTTANGRGLLTATSILLLVATAAIGCSDDDAEKESKGDGIVSVSKGQSAEPAVDPATVPRRDGPTLGAVKMYVAIYEKPDPRADKLGYLRLGARVPRGEKPVKFDACRGGYYRVLPKGYVCLDDGASIDDDHPLLKARLKGPDRTKPLPYAYGFVRAIAPRYYRLPTTKEQFKYEMSLKRHLRSFRRLKDKWNAIEVGSNDIPIDRTGRVLGEPPEEPPELTDGEKFGGSGEDIVPWFFDGGRKIPNVSSFKVPDYAVITNRVKRHAGLSLIDAFQGDDRHFALTTDLRLVPTSKLKPGRGSVFHGVEIGKYWELPVAFVKRRKVHRYDREGGRWKRRSRLAWGTPIQLTGEVSKNGKYRMLETDDLDWLRTRDLAIVVKTSDLPKFAQGNTKWIDVSIQRQTLTLFEGSTPVYATMVSTGRDGLGDPGKTHSTPRGTFRVRDKHITDTMDSDVLGSRFELQDVPWVQYFKAGYALHAAYWHTDYGRPRSHGCINMSPIDAYRTFWWTDPPMPERWHAVNASESMGEGTRIHIHP